MSNRIRLLAAGVTTALAVGTLGLSAAPADAASVTKTVNYDCVGTLMQPVPMMSFDPLTGLPIVTWTSFPVVVPVTTVPLTVTLPDAQGLADLSAGQSVPSLPATGTLGVGPVLTLLGATVQTVSTALALPLAGAPTTVPLSLGAAPVPPTALIGGQLPLTGAIAAFTAPATAGSYPVSFPTTLSLPLSHVIAGIPGTDTLTCTLSSAVTAAERVLTTLVVRAAAAGGTGGVGTGPGPVATGGTPQPVDTSSANPCVTTPAAKAGQRPSRMSGRAAKVSWKRKPAVRVHVTSRRKPAKGRVIACYGAMKVGQKALRRGDATLRTLRFYPGRYQVRLVYLGSARARAAARTITLRVTR